MITSICKAFALVVLLISMLTFGAGSAGAQDYVTEPPADPVVLASDEELLAAVNAFNAAAAAATVVDDTADEVLGATLLADGRIQLADGSIVVGTLLADGTVRLASGAIVSASGLQLAFTGGEASVPAAIGAGLIAAGGIFVLAARKRQS